jgi:hypothetical protein
MVTQRERGNREDPYDAIRRKLAEERKRQQEEDWYEGITERGKGRHQELDKVLAVALTVSFLATSLSTGLGLLLQLDFLFWPSLIFLGIFVISFTWFAFRQKAG